MFKYIILPFIIGLILRFFLYKIQKAHIFTIVIFIVSIIILACSVLLDSEFFGALTVISLSVSAGSVIAELVVRILKHRKNNKK